MGSLAEIRSRIESIDAELMDLIAERVAIARDAGEAKRVQGRAPRDFVVERTVIDRYRRGFADRSLTPETGERIAHQLFAETLRAQEVESRRSDVEAGTEVVVVGGAGRMGQWFARYLDDIGARVAIHDTEGDLEGFPSVDNLELAASAADAVLVSVPPSAVDSVLVQLTGIDTPIVDIASLKGPFENRLNDLADQQPVASVHPMWGPSTRVLSDKFVLLCDCGHPAATAMARRLIEPTQATVIELSLSEHDAAMAFTQVLPQAIGLVFAEVLASSGYTHEELIERGGRSFAAQTTVAEQLVGNDPGLYRQIQADNEHADDIYDRMHAAITQLDDDRHDPAAFADAMQRYSYYFDREPEDQHP